MEQQKNRIKCKICLQPSQNQQQNSLTQKLITPCKCNGSLLYIHQSCLKNWINHRFKKKNEASCQLCKFKYKMNLQYNLKLNCNKGNNSYMNILKFCAVASILIFLSIIIVATIYFQKQIVKIIILLILGLILVIFITLTGIFFKQCYIQLIQNWKIYSYSAQQTRQRIKNELTQKFFEVGLTQNCIQPVSAVILQQIQNKKVLNQQQLTKKKIYPVINNQIKNTNDNF